jgi:hypothetical protein
LAVDISVKGTSGKIPSQFLKCIATCPANNADPEANLATINKAYALGTSPNCTEGGSPSDRDYAFSLVMQYLSNLKSIMGFAELVWNDIRWLSVRDSDWNTNFQAAIGDDSASGLIITDTEAATITTPIVGMINSSDVSSLISR